MTLHYRTVGNNPPQRHYFIETDNGQPIADYDTLYTAAVVMRYLQGANLDLEERARARAALIAFDSARNRGEDSF